MNKASRAFREFTPETAHDYLQYRLSCDLFIESLHLPQHHEGLLFASELTYLTTEQIMAAAIDLWMGRRYDEIKENPQRLHRADELTREWSVIAGEPVDVEFIDKHYFGTASKEGITRLACALYARGPGPSTQNAFYGYSPLFQVWYMRIDE